MARRRFDFFYIELCCALNRRVARYALWLELSEHGHDPENIGRDGLLAFFDQHLDAFLAHQRCRVAGRSRQQLRRNLERFDPSVVTPYEVMERLATA
ncbi:MAG: hypothetical protein ACI8W3_001463 [Myxococcota bacterium]|jgi:hypothetical protein